MYRERERERERLSFSPPLVVSHLAVAPGFGAIEEAVPGSSKGHNTAYSPQDSPQDSPRLSAKLSKTLRYIFPQDSQRFSAKLPQELRRKISKSWIAKFPIWERGIFQVTSKDKEDTSMVAETRKSRQIVARRPKPPCAEINIYIYIYIYVCMSISISIITS